MLLPPRKRQYAAQIARAYQSAAERGQHRDLAETFRSTRWPREDSRFGLAKLAGERKAGWVRWSPPTRAPPGTVMGTVGYMAEQVRGEAVDHRTDIALAHSAKC
jgi:hypothetical protein